METELKDKIFEKYFINCELAKNVCSDLDIKSKELTQLSNQINKERSDEIREMQRIKNLYNNKKNINKDKVKFLNFNEFYKWYISQYAKQQGKCYYCKTKEKVIATLFTKKFLSTKRTKRGHHLEVERLDSKNNEYSKTNCVLACYFCNNDKSDIFSEDEYFEYLKDRKIFFENQYKENKMIIDQETNFVYFSSLIKKDKKYLPFWERLEPILIDNNIDFRFIENTRDIWCRDYMPIQKGINDFIQFVYFPDYYIFPEYIAKLTIPSETKIIEKIHKKNSKLIIDGGNVIKSKTIAILTEKVIDENSNLEPKTVLSILKKDLGVNKVYLIPKAPYDYTGHADGMIRFINENDLLVADYSNESNSWRKKMDKALEKTGLNIIPFPSEVVEEKNEDSDYTAKGIYINFAQIGNIILFPQFKLDSDGIALEKTKKLYPKCKVIPVNSNEIANDGGVLNCITWNIKK